MGGARSKEDLPEDVLRSGGAGVTSGRPYFFLASCPDDSLQEAIDLADRYGGFHCVGDGDEGFAAWKGKAAGQFLTLKRLSPAGRKVVGIAIAGFGHCNDEREFLRQLGGKRGHEQFELKQCGDVKDMERWLQSEGYELAAESAAASRGQAGPPPEESGRTQAIASRSGRTGLFGSVASLFGGAAGAGAGAGARCAAEERGHGPEEARAAGPGGYGLRAPALLGRRAGLAPARRCGLGRQLVALALQPALHVLHIAALLELKLLVTPLTAQLAQELPLVVAVAEARDGDPNHLPPCWRQSFESQELAGRFALPGREALVPVTHTVEAAIPVGQVDRLLQRVVRAGRQEEVWPAGGDAGPARPQNILRQVLLRPCAPHAVMDRGAAHVRLVGHSLEATAPRLMQQP
mmetsp:Transcript_53122/g.165018  ORF Transcript_53122/g.165018 Transcript_53122/m.165018 type:complete len:405 (-) Transcript_53122:2-1216(-)